MSETLPSGLLLGFYGDDFTGSTATLEALAFAGLKTVLLFDTPDEALLAAFPDCRAIGIAGLSRSRSPAWMTEHLPPVFARLKAARPALAHYKICSTFDSAPTVGSIGKAVELGADAFGNDWTPVFTAVPSLARWQVFGNLFAGAQGEAYRIDRHPVMMRHPVTPMAEADLRVHLGKQTGRKVGLIDIASMKAGQASARIVRETAEGAQILLIDGLDEETLVSAGGLMWEGRHARPFVAGSQGVEYALIAWWRSQGLLADAPALAAITRADRIAAVSGSCSPLTARQIACAEANGFAAIALDTHLAVDDRAWQQELARAQQLALEALSSGRDALIHSAKGPDDPTVALLNQAIALSGVSQEEVSRRIGSGLGEVLSRLVREQKLTRAVVSGGDSSGQACIAMGLLGVTALAPLAPGAPLCLARSRHAHLDGLEIALKGGQMGKEDFFLAAKG